MAETEQVEANKEADPCKKYFLNKFDLAQHIRTQIGEEHSYCQKGFAQRCDLKPQRTELEQLEIKKEYNLCQFFGCPVCYKVFLTKDILKRHLQTTGCNVKSSDCHKIFENETTDTLKDHLFTRFGAKPYVCEVYKQTFWLKTKLKAHFKTHQGDKPYMCKVCHKIFENESNLKDHHSTHFGAKPYILYMCEVCKETFWSKTNLKVHLLCHPTEKKCQNHSGEKSCEKRTRTIIPTSFTHFGGKPFACEVCKQTFWVKTNLKVHLKTHHEEKQYKCEECQKEFNCKFNLKCHLNTHSAKKQHKCKVCHKLFKTESTLRSHRQTHTNCVKPYPCDIAYFLDVLCKVEI